MAEMKPGRFVVLSLVRPGDPPAACPDHLKFLIDRGWTHVPVSVPWTHPAKRFFHFLKLLPALRGAALIQTNEYFNAAMVSAWLVLMRAFGGGRAKHVVDGLNVAGNRRLATGWKLLDRSLNALFFGRVDMAIVASRPERAIFHRDHAIPLGRFAFVHWSYDLPSVKGNFQRPDLQSGRPYFCLIGRNNRDHASFCAALDGLEADGVIIAHLSPGISLPANVRAYTEIPLGDCIDCIRHARANVVIVQDAERGAGHITIVTAMHCARAQIISDVDTTRDYFIPGDHALTVPLGDVAALRQAMIRLLENPAMAMAMGRKAADFAANHLTHARRTAVVEDRLKTWLDTGKITWEQSPPMAGPPQVNGMQA